MPYLSIKELAIVSDREILSQFKAGNPWVSIFIRSRYNMSVSEWYNNKRLEYILGV